MATENAQPAKATTMDERRQELKSIKAVTVAARDEALTMDMRFEAYLLDMAITALDERLESESSPT